MKRIGVHRPVGFLVIAILLAVLFMIVFTFPLLEGLSSLNVDFSSPIFVALMLLPLIAIVLSLYIYFGVSSTVETFAKETTIEGDKIRFPKGVFASKIVVLASLSKFNEVWDTLGVVSGAQRRTRGYAGYYEKYAFGAGPIQSLLLTKEKELKDVTGLVVTRNSILMQVADHTSLKYFASVYTTVIWPMKPAEVPQRTITITEEGSTGSLRFIPKENAIYYELKLSPHGPARSLRLELVMGGTSITLDRVFKGEEKVGKINLYNGKEPILLSFDNLVPPAKLLETLKEEAGIEADDVFINMERIRLKLVLDLPWRMDKWTETVIVMEPQRV